LKNLVPPSPPPAVVKRGGVLRKSKQVESFRAMERKLGTEEVGKEKGGVGGGWLGVEDVVPVKRSSRVSAEAFAVVERNPLNKLQFEFYRVVRALFWDAADRCLGVSQKDVLEARAVGLRLPVELLERERSWA
jgi:hypothetical protein